MIWALSEGTCGGYSGLRVRENETLRGLSFQEEGAYRAPKNQSFSFGGDVLFLPLSTQLGIRFHKSFSYTASSLGGRDSDVT